MFLWSYKPFAAHLLILHACVYHTSKLESLLCRGFNDALNGFPDDGWSLLSSDGAEDITITVNSSPNKLVGSHLSPSPLFSAIGGGILCAKASMLLQVYI
jgi:hypothetical protein